MPAFGGRLSDDDIQDVFTKYLDEENRVVGEPNIVAEAMQMTQANLKDHLSSVERHLIEQAMAATDGVVAKAARLLNMRRTTLVEKLGKYSLNQRSRPVQYRRRYGPGADIPVSRKFRRCSANHRGWSRPAPRRSRVPLPSTPRSVLIDAVGCADSCHQAAFR